MTFTDQQLNQLRDAYASIETVSTERLGEFRALFGKCSEAGIRQLVAAKIKFVSKLAVNELIRRGLTVSTPAAPGAYKAMNGRPFRV